MTESSPQPGDNDTHDDATIAKTSTESAPGRGTTAIGEDTSSHVRAPSGGGAKAEEGSKVAVGESSGDEDGSDDDEEEDEDDDNEEEEDEDDDNEEEEDEDDDNEEEEDEDEEPKLKYARLTQHLGPVYRNGDATSAFLVAGDKMVRMPQPPVGTGYRSR
jgi:hypothetical protein